VNRFPELPIVARTISCVAVGKQTARSVRQRGHLGHADDPTASEMLHQFVKPTTTGNAKRRRESLQHPRLTLREHDPSHRRAAEAPRQLLDPHLLRRLRKKRPNGPMNRRRGRKLTRFVAGIARHLHHCYAVNLGKLYRLIPPQRTSS